MTAWGSNRSYYYRLGNDLIFGSELKAVLLHPEVPRRLDMTGLGFYLSLNYVPCPHTLVEGVDKAASWALDGVGRRPRRFRLLLATSS